jgi:hypothetical protein
MIHIDKDSEGPEHVKLEDYDDDSSDSFDQSVDAMMSFNITNTIRIQAQKECHKLRNAKCTKCRHHIVKQRQRGQGNLYNPSTSDLHTIINVGRDDRNVIIARLQESDEVEAYSPTNYHIPLDYLGTTQKRKPEVREQLT